MARGQRIIGVFADCQLVTTYSQYSINAWHDDIHIGGDLHKYIGVDETKKLIDYTDQIYLNFGADPKLEGTEYKEEINNSKYSAYSMCYSWWNICIFSK